MTFNVCNSSLISSFGQKNIFRCTNKYFTSIYNTKEIQFTQILRGQNTC